MKLVIAVVLTIGSAVTASAGRLGPLTTNPQQDCHWGGSNPTDPCPGEKHPDPTSPRVIHEVSPLRADFVIPDIARFWNW